MNMKLADHCGQALARAADDDPLIWVLDGDLADSDGAMHFAERHPERFLMTGIAEQNLVSVAAGMATAGLRPWAFSFAAFLAYRACDQVRVCLSQAQQPVVLLGSHGGGCAGRNGKTHAAINDLAIMLSFPGMQVFSPADFGDVDFTLRALLESPAPAYVRLPRRLFSPGDVLPQRPAWNRWLRAKAKVSLVATGVASWWALGAATILSGWDHDVGVLHVLRLSPLGSLAEQLADIETLIVIEDHGGQGGLASLLSRKLPSQQVHVIGWPDGWFGKSGGDDELRRAAGLDDEALALRICALIKR